MSTQKCNETYGHTRRRKYGLSEEQKMNKKKKKNRKKNPTNTHNWAKRTGTKCKMNKTKQ